MMETALCYLMEVIVISNDVIVIDKVDVMVIDKGDVMVMDKGDVIVMDKGDVIIMDEDELIVIDKDDVIVKDKGDVIVMDKDDVIVIDKDGGPACAALLHDLSAVESGEFAEAVVAVDHGPLYDLSVAQEKAGLWGRGEGRAGGQGGAPHSQHNNHHHHQGLTVRTRRAGLGRSPSDLRG